MVAIDSSDVGQRLRVRGGDVSGCGGVGVGCGGVGGVRVGFCFGWSNTRQRYFGNDDAGARARQFGRN